MRSPHRLAVLAACGALWAAACSGWSPTKPFEREAPPVKEAIGALDAGDASAASAVLEAYLSTGKCNDGKIGAPDSITKLSNGSFDLGLSLFRIGEAYGRRFGEEEMDAGGSDVHDKRMAQIDCALRIVEAVGNDDAQPIDLRARARYLEGNLHFLGGEYEQAVKAYDDALALAPGMVDGGDAVGRDAAWNRAIALQRIEDQKKDAGNDGGQPDAGDGGKGDGGGDAGRPDASDGGDGGGGNDAGDAGDGGGGDDGGDDGGRDAGPDGSDGGTPPPQNQSSPDAAAPPPPPSESEDDRILDRLEAAPTFQQEAARKMAKVHRVRGMADK